MRYMLLIYTKEDAAAPAALQGPKEMMAAYRAYTDAMAKAGILKGGERLQSPASATTVRSVDGKTKVLNGPYAETREQLGGYYMIDVPDLDAALSWASRCPGASNGTIEVRAIQDMT